MKNVRKILACVLAACVISTVAAGCSSSGNSAGKSKTVTLKYTYWGGDLEKKTTDLQVKKFEKAHPNIKINAQLISGDYLTKLNVMASGNTLPDVGYMTESSALLWAKKNMFLSVDEITKYGQMSKKLDSVEFKSDDKPVAYGVADEVMLLYYNKNLFTKAGIETPPATADKAWNWDKFIEVAQKLTTDKNGKHPTDAGFDSKNIVTYGINMPTSDMSWLSFVFSNGGGLVSEDGKKLLFGKQETIDALQKLADLSLKYHVAPNPAQAKSVPSTDTALMTGKVAMAVDGQWALQTIG